MPKTNIKSKTEKIAHPYSRKAMKEERRLLHKQRVDQVRQGRCNKLDAQAERLRWFHERLDERPSYSKGDLVQMVEEFQARFDEELEQISIIHSVGARKGSQQHAARQAAIRMTQDLERAEFEGPGMAVPDLCHKDTLRFFRLWGGEMKYVQNFKMKHIGVRDRDKLQAQAAAAAVEEKEEKEGESVADSETALS